MYMEKESYLRIVSSSFNFVSVHYFVVVVVVIIIIANGILLVDRDLEITHLSIYVA